MSAHTLNDGTTPDTTIGADAFDEWWLNFAPSRQLIGSYYKRDLGWDNFAAQYNAQLERPDMQMAVYNLAMQAMRENVTLLCTEAAPVFCHRRLVAEACQIVVPPLEVVLE